MQKQTISIPFINNNEEKYLKIPDLFKIGDITIGVQVELPYEDSGMLTFKFTASPLDLLPLEVNISIYSESGIIMNSNFDCKFYKQIPYINSSCIFSFKKISLLESRDRSKEYRMDITIEIKPDSKIEKKLSVPPKSNNDLNPYDILQFLTKNNKVTQNDLDTIKRDFQIMNSSSQTTANKNENKQEKDKIDPLSVKTSPKTTVFEPPKHQEQIQSKTIKNDRLNSNKNKQPINKKHYNGLLNQGATCYLNAIIQSLFHIPFFRNVIYQFKAKDDINPNTKIINSLQTLFYNLEHGNFPCSTNVFTSSLGMTKQDVLIHRDAQEFLIHFSEKLCDILKSDENQKDKISYIFGGKTIQTVKNNRQQLISSHEEEIFELIIGLADSIESSLKNFIKEEKVDDYNDDRTQSVQTVTMQTKLLNLPRVLRLLIKRYKFDKDLQINCKDNSRMEFKEDLDLQPYVYNNVQNGCTKYKLYGVIVHQGQINLGHYYVYLKPEMKENWILFNDSFFSVSNSHDAIENNFGGLNFGFDYIRNYSAYILIYVRVDCINEMFMKSQNESTKAIQIPRIVSDHAEERNLKELQREKSDPLCQITLNIFNERCIIENCTKGIVNIFNEDFMINVSVDLRLKSIEIYEKVANLIKLNKNCIRLWILSNDYQKLIRIVDQDEQINQLGAQNLFLEIKKENENLNCIENSHIYFIILYTKLKEKPFLYLKAGHYDSEQIVFDSLKNPLRYEIIINDVLTMINQNLSTDIKALNSNAFVVNSTKFERVFSSSTCTVEDGGLIVLQIDEKFFSPDQSIIEIFEDEIGLKNKLQYIKKNLTNNSQNQNKAFFNYYDFIELDLPRTPDKYIENKNNTKFVKIYNFNDISKIEGMIEIPLKIKTYELINFIKFVFSFDNFDDKKNCILLFAGEENSELP